MTSRERPALEIVRSFMKDMEALNYGRAVQKLAADLEYVNPPPIGRVHGPDGMRAVLEPFFAPTLENEFVILREAAVGEMVFLERLDRHRLADRWVELPVTGVFQIRAGLITYWRDYFDATTILNQWPS